MALRLETPSPHSMSSLAAPSLDTKIVGLRNLLADLHRVVVCFSGGVDSGYLLAEAVGTLGRARTYALTAVSPSLAPQERSDAAEIAKQLGAQHLLVDTHELDDARYAANPVNRCYFCKTEVYSTAVDEAHRLGLKHVLDGFNIDDRGDYRPGRRAAREQGIRSPLDELDFTKTDIREAARRLELPLWDKPALACLSSRFPYGVPITPDRLERVAMCERTLRDLGFRVCRVRFYDAMARIEVELAELPRLRTPSVRTTILRKFLDAGFETVTVDPGGYQSGALNESIARPGSSPTAPGSTSGIPL